MGTGVSDDIGIGGREGLYAIESTTAYNIDIAHTRTRRFTSVTLEPDPPSPNVQRGGRKSANVLLGEKDVEAIRESIIYAHYRALRYIE